MIRLLPATLSFALAAVPAHATYDCAADAMVVFDGSASMSEIGWDSTVEPRIGEARAAMRRAMPDIAERRRLGLLVYGPGYRGACENISLRFPPVVDAAPRIIDAIDTLTPGGMTPLAESVVAAAEVMDYRNRPAVVVLVTDGNETCGGTPCATGAALEAAGWNLTVHVIGFKADVEFFSWDNPEQRAFAKDATVARCLADQTGGMFVSTDTVDELTAALERTLGCTVIGRVD